MHPFHKALHKKKLEGIMIHISPAKSIGGSHDEMKQAAARGDGAPEILDTESELQDTPASASKFDGTPIEGSPAEEAGESPAIEASEKSPSPFHDKHSKHNKKPTSLREKAEIEMKKKGY